MKDATRVVKAGLPDAAQGRAFLPGPTFAGPYHFSGEPGTSSYTYGRYGNPTQSPLAKRSFISQLSALSSRAAS